MPIDMQQAWLLTAIPLFAFVVVSLFGKRVPRQGDWIVALAGFACFAISIMFIIDFQSYFQNSGFEPGNNNKYLTFFHFLEIITIFDILSFLGNNNNI